MFRLNSITKPNKLSRFNITNTKIFVLILFLFSGCASVEKYNQSISKLHSPEELQKDVDYAYNKITKLHPDLYWYISEDSLYSEFKTLKESIQSPMSSADFYKQLAPVFSSIKQGHTYIVPPQKKQSKKEIKEKGRIVNPFKPLAFENIDNKMIISKNYGKDSTIMEGSEVIKVDGENTNELLASFQNLNTGDGFNETFVPRFSVKTFDKLYVNTHEQKDSIQITLMKNDSIYSKYLFSYEKKKPIIKDSTNNSKTDTILKIAKVDKKNSKQIKKQRKAWEKKYAYDKYTKEKYRSLEFIELDSVSSISYMKIRGFKGGKYKEFYEECFSKIDSSNSKYLVIDLRNNTGGSLDEIHDLYSYLTDKEFVFVEKSKMTTRTSFMYPHFHSNSYFEKSVALLLNPFFQILKVKKNNGVPYFSLKSSKKTDPKANNFNGKIYVLINGVSFSASCILSTNLNSTERATFVGEETGGAYNGTVAGKRAIIELPNSKVNMKIGLMTIKAPYTTTPDGFGIKPDIYISNTSFGNDEQLEWILDDVKGLH